MSAIGHAPKAKLLISSHSDYRREDFIFARTQSCAMREMPWANRIRPLRSWDSILYPALGIAGAALLILDLLR